MAFTTLEGVRLFFESSGARDGPAVLFPTGGAGDATMWARAGWSDVTDGCRQVRMDHRGHGRSDRPTSLDGHRIEEYVADVGAVLDAGEDEPCPTLIVCGEREDPEGNVPKAAAALPDGRARMLPGFGHLRAFWHAEATAPLARSFLVDCGLPAWDGART